MPGIRGDDALERQDRVEGLAERARVDVIVGRHVPIGSVGIVAPAHARLRRFVTPALAGSDAVAKRRVQGLGAGASIAVKGVRNRAMAAKARRVDVDLGDDGRGSNEGAALGRPIGQARAEGDDQVALADQLARRRRAEAAADAKRPRIVRK